MQKLKQLWTPFFTKEKFFIILLIFIFINITTYMIYKQSIFAYPDYAITYPHAGLQFFYYIYCIGINPFLFILFMLLMPNLMSYEFLNMHQSQFSYMIESRISKKQYYLNIFIKNIIFSFITVFIMQILLVMIVHIFYIPIQFHTTVYPEHYYITSQVLSSNEILNMILFIVSVSLGYGLVSSILFSMQVIISNKYIYRCFGVIFGILLVLVPALIQGLIPIPDASFILQINNIIAIGMENVRTNPLGMSNRLLFISCFLIYSFISYQGFQYMLKWRERYD